MKNVKKLLKTVGLFSLAVLLFSSCNRGYGCPYDFSVSKDLFDTVGIVFQLLINFL